MSEPEYYCKAEMSPLKAFKNGLLTREEYIGFLKGNVIKYILRCESKGDFISDLDKAVDYIWEMYYLLGSESLDMNINRFEKISKWVEEE